MAIGRAAIWPSKRVSTITLSNRPRWPTFRPSSNALANCWSRPGRRPTRVAEHPALADYQLAAGECLGKAGGGVALQTAQPQQSPKGVGRKPRLVPLRGEDFQQRFNLAPAGD